MEKSKMIDELYDDEAEALIQIAIQQPQNVANWLRQYGVFDNIDDETIREQYEHRFGEYV